MPNPLHVAVVDPDSLSRQGLGYILGNHGYEITAEASSVNALTETLERGQFKPQLILVDWSLVRDAVAERINELRAKCSDGRLVVLSQTLDTEAVLECFNTGADGFLLKSIQREALIAAIQLILSDERVYPSELISEVFKGHMPAATAVATPKCGEVSLSEREQEILRWLVRGASNKMIANWLNITEPTVKVHLQNLLKKLKVENRTQAAVWAVQNLSRPAFEGTEALREAEVSGGSAVRPPSAGQEA